MVKGKDRLETVATISDFLPKQLGWRRNSAHHRWKQCTRRICWSRCDRSPTPRRTTGSCCRSCSWATERDRPNDPRLKQLRQRITVWYHLNPLTRAGAGNATLRRIGWWTGEGRPSPRQPCGVSSITARASRASSMRCAIKRCSRVLSSAAHRSMLLAWSAAPFVKLEGDIHT